MNCKMIDIYRHVDNYAKYHHVKSVLEPGNKAYVANPYITIAIPTYKRPSLLKEAIDSALNQDNPSYEFEVIVIDNEVRQSVETETEKLIKTYSDSRLLYYRNEKNLGMFGNWNRCIELARGKWVAFLHDDDLIASDYIAKISKLIISKKEVGAIMVIFGIIGKTIPSDSPSFSRNVIKEFLNRHLKNKLLSITTTDIQLFSDNPYGAPTCGALFNRNLAIKEGGFNEAYFPSADWFFVFKFNKSYKVYKTFDILGYYRILENESLNVDTLRQFVVDGINFRQFSRNLNLLGATVYNLFRYEQHVCFLEWVMRLDKSHSIKPEDFNDKCEYKIRPLRLWLYKKVRLVYWRIKKLSVLIWG